MRIIHQYRTLKVEKDSEDCADLVLGNDLGNFLYLLNGDQTRYRGFYCADPSGIEGKIDLFKVIDEIRLDGAKGVEELKNSIFKVERKDKNGQIEDYFMPGGLSSLCLKTSKLAEAEITLDVRRPYDTRQMGRSYRMEEKDGCLVVEFTKRRDLSEDDQDGKKEFVLYLAVKTDRDKYAPVGEFEAKYYAKDHARNSFPWDRYVYRAFAMSFKKAVFSVARTKKEAVAQAKAVFTDFDKLYKKTRDDMSDLGVENISDPEIKMACLAAKSSLRTLMVRNRFVGAYAGLPWFFQFWNRDEALSICQLHRLDKKTAEEIILKQLDAIIASGRQPRQRLTFDADELQSADVIGLLARGCLQLFQEGRVSKAARGEMVKRFEKALPALLRERTVDDLVVNLPHETWMDSVERDAFRIEIQAGRLALYKLLWLETGNDQYRILLETMQKKVVEKFYRNGILWDSPDSESVRPNVFLAYHVYPELLSAEKWEVTFDHVLPELYLEWGGLATVSQTDGRFIANDSGENSPSYHNGDSWYYLNEIAAAALYRVNPAKYSEYINEIMEASTKELLYMGAIGHHAEISSAEKQQSLGCPAQLWSAAMYLNFFDVALGG